MTGATSTSTVLVVDDEQRLRDLVRGYLEHEGFNVLAAADGQVALDLARQHGPDVVVLDLMLPGLGCVPIARRPAAACDRACCAGHTRRRNRRPGHAHCRES